MTSLPGAGRLVLKVIYGVKISRLLLLGSQDPSTDGCFDIYGFITRKSETRVLLAPSHITSNAGRVFSGEVLDACLDRLSGFIDDRVV